MRKGLLAIFITCSVVFLLSSCQKELSYTAPVLPSQTDSLIGDWKFTLLDVKTNTRFSSSILGTTSYIEFLSDFLSKNNAGILKIDSFNLDLADLSYSIDTVGKVNTYVGGLLVQTVEEPIVYDAAPYSTLSEYRLIGKDSINFPNSDFINLPADLLFVSQPISGLRFKFEGDKLKFNTSINVKGVDNSTGVDFDVDSRIQVVITFQKQ